MPPLSHPASQRQQWLFFPLTCFCVSLAALGQSAAHDVPKPGITDGGLRHSIGSLKAEAVFHAPDLPDWMAVTPNAVWVTSSGVGVITELDPVTNRTGRSIHASEPCSGLLFAFDSLWIPSCGDHTVLRVDPKTLAVLATVAAAPADAEGGITAGAGSVWIVTERKGTLTRIDAKTNRVGATIAIPSGSYNPVFADGSVWVSSHDHDALLQVDPATDKLVATIAVGKGPRFVTAGSGSVWTLNQGDGTVSRVDTASAKKVATIMTGIPGKGGEIAYGFGAVWATVFDYPVTRIDATTNAIIGQWQGPGGDSIRTGFGAVWLTDYFHGTISRYSPNNF